LVAPSSLSMTAHSFFRLPPSVLSRQSVVAMPCSRFVLEGSYAAPPYVLMMACCTMCVVVVLPFVPVMTMVLWPSPSSLMMLPSILSASFPGNARAVRPNMRMTR